MGLGSQVLGVDQEFTGLLELLETGLQDVVSVSKGVLLFPRIDSTSQQLPIIQINGSLLIYPIPLRVALRERVLFLDVAELLFQSRCDSIGGSLLLN